MAIHTKNGFPALCLCLIASIGLSACGGSGGNSNPSPSSSSSSTSSSSSSSGGTTTIETGVLKGGLEGAVYTSGSETGTVNSEGEFSYEAVNGVPQLVTFSVGGVEYSRVTGAANLTALNLVENGTSSSTELLNIIAFFQLLDADQNPQNGYSLSPELITFLETNEWTAIDFTQENFANLPEVTSIISDLSAIEGEAREIADTNAVKMQLEQSYWCSASGVYSGTFSGDDSGTFVLGVDSANGQVGGAGHSVIDDILFGTAFEDGEPLSVDGNDAFISGGVSTGAEFTGTLSNFSSISGQWANLVFGDTGTFTGNKVGASEDDYLRYTFVFNDGTISTQDDIAANAGLVALNLSASDEVSAIMVDLMGTQTVLTGTLTNNDLTMSSADETITVTGFLARNAEENPTGDIPAFGGTWSNSSTGVLEGTGVMFGSGCRFF